MPIGAALKVMPKGRKLNVLFVSLCIMHVYVFYTQFKDLQSYSTAEYYGEGRHLILL